jgi:hypothetical protein
MPRGPVQEANSGVSNSLPPFVNDPAHWRKPAEEARAMVDHIDDLPAKAAMIRIAEDYERLAKRAEQRAIGREPNSN